MAATQKRYLAMGICVFALVSAPPALAAGDPAPDPVPHAVQPDPAPVKSTPAPVQRQQPTVTQPVIQAPTQRVVTVQQSAPVTAARPATKPAVHKGQPRKHHRAKRHAAPAAPKPAPVAYKVRIERPLGAVAAVSSVAKALERVSPPAAKGTDGTSYLLAAAALLLLVAAGASVLRLSAYMPGDLWGGRPG